MESNVKVKIDAIDNSKAAFASLGSSLGKVEDATKSVKTKLEDMQPAFKTMAAVGAAALAGIVAASSKSIKAYGEVERAQRQLRHAVINVSKGTAEQVTQIEEITGALEKKAGVDADALTMGVAQLSTFGLSSGAVVDLTKSLADLTVNQSGLNATSDDYIGSANSIAKALNGQFGILEKSGIRFTEAQQNLILYGTETEKVGALQEGFAQNLRETTDTVAGTDLAAAKSQRTFENLSEAIGKSLAPAFGQIAEKVQPVIERFTEWADKNPELLEKVILIAAAVAGFAVAIGTIGLVLPPILAGLGLIAGIFGALSLPVIAIGIAIAAVGAALYLLWKNWDEVTAWISGAIDTVTTYISEKWHSVMTGVSAVVSTVWQTIKDAFFTSINFIVGVVATLLDTLLPNWQGIFQSIFDTVVSIFDRIKESLQIAFSFLSEILNTWKIAFLEVWTTIWDTAKSLFEGVWTGLVTVFDGVIDGITSGMETLIKPIQKVIDLAERAMELAGGALGSAGGFISRGVQGILDRGSDITGKADGGTVTGGIPYIVGEVGPELFVPGRTGTIIPNHALAGAGPGGNTFNITFTGNSFMGERDMAEKMGNQLIRIIKQNGRL